jgi:transposase
MTQTMRRVTTGTDSGGVERGGVDSAAVIGGVDTHRDTHHAAVVDPLGRLLGSAQFDADEAGYAALLAWLRGFGTLERVGVEGTGSYGAGLARYLNAAAITVVEVDRPDRRARRRAGKSDPLDAQAAARAALAGTATATPKTRTGPVEAIRALRVARSGAVKARTAALNQLKSLITTAPEPLRATLRAHRGAALLHACTELAPPGQDTLGTEQLLDPATATRAALTALAGRIHALNNEITLADQRLATLVPKVAPRTTALFGVGPDTAGQLLATAGDNPHRINTEAALAHLCGAAPIPASSGRRDRHRLNRGGDRQANRALHTIALIRLRHDPRTRHYMQRRTHEGLSKRDILRCLKRYIAREIHTTLLADLAALTP